MNALLKYLLSYCIISFGDGDGGPVDRGDTFESTPEPAAEPEKAADPEPAAEPEKEEPAAEPEKEEPSRDEKGKFIPKAEFDNRLKREREARESAERRLAELEKQIKQNDRTDVAKKLDEEIEALEAKLEEARLDGKREDALRLSKELRMKEREIARLETSDVSTTAAANAREEVRMDLIIEKMETEYEILNEKSEQFDQDVVDLVLATQRDLIQRERMLPSYALEAAVSKVMTKLAPPPAQDTGGGLKGAKLAEDRSKAQIAKNVDTASRQPASIKELGADSDKAGQTKDLPNVETLTFEEFNALPETAKAKMRGDLL